MARVRRLAAGAAASPREPRPIFIIGAPRSGTSVLTWALGQHPDIQPMPETAWIASMAVGAYLSHEKGSERGRFSHLSNVEFPPGPFMRRMGESIDAIVHDAYAERCRRLYGEASVASLGWRLGEGTREGLEIKRRGDDPKTRWIDGTPLNSQYLWGIAQMFPEARFIHSLRRPEEVALSLERFDRVGAEPQALDTGLDTWISHTENAWLAERGLGSGKVFRLDFERFVADGEGVLRELCEFLGEPWAPECLLPLNRKINSSAVDQERDGILERLREKPLFQTAEAIYDAACARPAGEAPDDEAWEIVHQRFLDYCRGRALV